MLVAWSFCYCLYVVFDFLDDRLLESKQALQKKIASLLVVLVLLAGCSGIPNFEATIGDSEITFSDKAKRLEKEVKKLKRQKKKKAVKPKPPPLPLIEEPPVLPFERPPEPPVEKQSDECDDPFAFLTKDCGL